MDTNHTRVCVASNFCIFVHSNGSLFGTGNFMYLPKTNSTPSFQSGFSVFRKRCENFSQIIVKSPNCKFISASCKMGNHTIALTSDGRCFSAGGNQFGCLGKSTVKEYCNELEEIPDLKNCSISQISACYSSLFYCKFTNTVYACGNNPELRIGPKLDSLENYFLKIRALDVKNINIKSIHAGGFFTLFVTQEGELHYFGTLRGINHSKKNDLLKIDTLGHKVRKCSAGYLTFFCICDNGSIIGGGQGYSKDGACTVIKPLSNKKIVYLCESKSSSIFASVGNVVYVKDTRQIVKSDEKIGEFNIIRKFKYVKERIVEVACGESNFFVLLENGDLYATGNNGNNIFAIKGDSFDVFVKLPINLGVAERGYIELFLKMLRKKMKELNFIDVVVKTIS